MRTPDLTCEEIRENGRTGTGRVGLRFIFRDNAGRPLEAQFTFRDVYYDRVREVINLRLSPVISPLIRTETPFSTA